MLTPKEQLLLDRLKLQPTFMHAMTQLQLEVLPSEAHRSSLAVAARVDTIIHDFEKARNLPATTRSYYSEPSAPRIFWSTSQVKEWISVNNFSL